MRVPVKAYLLLAIASLCVFAGRGWQLIRWDAPLRTLFWDQSLMEPVVRWLTGWNWQSYATNLQIDQAIQTMQETMGWFFFLAAIATLFVHLKWRITRYTLYTGAALLLFITLLHWKEEAYATGQLLELTIQWSTPLILVMAVYGEYASVRLRTVMKMAIAATFIGHGLYAIGFYPVPGHFLQMVISIFRVSEDSALWFLKIAGALDFVVAIVLFLPLKRGKSIALGYAIFWGFVTAMARLVANFYWEIPWQSLAQWGHEVIFRLPHALIPLTLLLFIYSNRNEH